MFTLNSSVQHCTKSSGQGHKTSKRNEKHVNGNKDIKIILFIDDMIICVDNSKKITKKSSWDIRSYFSKLQVKKTT